jgi:hypothetical protein
MERPTPTPESGEKLPKPAENPVPIIPPVGGQKLPETPKPLIIIPVHNEDSLPNFPFT